MTKEQLLEAQRAVDTLKRLEVGSRKRLDEMQDFINKLAKN
jgi:hypothetical protein